MGDIYRPNAGGSVRDICAIADNCHAARLARRVVESNLIWPQDGIARDRYIVDICGTGRPATIDSQPESEVRVIVGVRAQRLLEVVQPIFEQIARFDLHQGIPLIAVMPVNRHMIGRYIEIRDSQVERDAYVLKSYRGNRLLDARVGAQTDSMSLVLRFPGVPFDIAALLPACKLVLEVIGEDGEARGPGWRDVYHPQAGVAVRHTGIGHPAQRRRGNVRCPSGRVEGATLEGRKRGLSRDQ